MTARALTSICIAVTALIATAAAAQAACYIELRGSALQYGYSRAGPYASRSVCESMVQRLGLAGGCTCEADGPSPEEIEWMRQQAEEARIREEARQAEERRLAAERERRRQIYFFHSQGNDMLNAGLFAEAIRAYQTALSYEPNPVIQNSLSYAQFREAFARGHSYFDGHQWDLAIGAYREALNFRPNDRAAASNIAAAETNKRLEQHASERRAQLEAGFVSVQGAIDAHIAMAEADRAAELQRREASGKRKPPLAFGDPSSPTQAALIAKIAVLDSKIESDKQAIRNLGLGNLNAEIEDWVDLDEQARQEAEEAAQDAVRDLLYDAFKYFPATKLKAFDRARGVRAVHWMENCHCGLNNPALIERVKTLSRRANAPGFVQDVEDLLKAFEPILKMEEGQRQGKRTLEVAAEILDIFVDNSRVKEALALGKVSVATYYRKRTKEAALAAVENLTRVTEDQLKALPHLQATLIKHVKERRELKRLLTTPTS